jgi:hypothetical protein
MGCREHGNEASGVVKGGIIDLGKKIFSMKLVK